MKKKFVLLFILLLFPLQSVMAGEVKEVEKFILPLENKAVSQADLGSEGIGMFSYSPNRSSYYEFVDELGNYNIVFGLANDSNHFGWVTLNDKLELEREITIEKSLPMFGNAIYADGYLYVVTGKNDTTTPSSVDEQNYPLDYGNVVVLSVSKYDSNGKQVNRLDITGRETSRLIKAIQTPGTKNFSYLASGARYPFDAGNCDITIHDGNLIIVFGKKMYNGHQMSYMSIVDKDTLKHVSKPTELDGSNPYYGITQGDYWISHSFDQRVITTSDGGLLLADQGDAFKRGFVISKVYQNTANRYTIKSLIPFHFRESDDSAYGYNTTFANLGNIVEVEDGYILVASSEKTLSINYAENRAANEARNIFIQKYNKDFKNSTIQTLSLLKTSDRVSESSRTDEENIGEFRLPSNGLTDYGVKWLTNYTTDKTVLGSRAIKIDEQQILILWVEQDMKKGTYGMYELIGDKRYYYEIIDHNGNVIEGPIEVSGAVFSSLIHYNYIDGYLYWTQEVVGKNEIALHRLNINHEDEIEFEGKDEKIDLLLGREIDLKALLKNSNQNLVWNSSNPNVATVDEFGLVKSLSEGKTDITVTTESGKSTMITIVVKKNILGDVNGDGKVDAMDLLEVVSKKMRQISFRDLTYKHVDINQNGRIDVADIFYVLYHLYIKYQI